MRPSISLSVQMLQSHNLWPSQAVSSCPKSYLTDYDSIAGPEPLMGTNFSLSPTYQTYTDIYWLVD